MVGCEGECGNWFHLHCLKLVQCTTHAPPHDESSGTNPPLTCLITAQGAHINVAGDAKWYCASCQKAQA